MAKKKKPVDDLALLEPGKLTFSRTPGGVLSLKIGRKLYPRVHAYRSFPLSREDSFISIRDTEDNEIGLLPSIAELDEDMAELLSEELGSRYFTPQIRSIVSLKEEFGYVYWEVDTDAGRSRFTARVGHNAAIQVGDTRVIIVDVDGNRFELVDYTTLDPKHQRIVELLL